jgi:ADP-L-glycero-D-manno-heptose 6-epimerase
MIILTGGAGFIGSCFLWKLNLEGISDIIVVDDIKDDEKERNLSGKKYLEYIQKDDFLKDIKENKTQRPDYIIHMGACSSTIEPDSDYIMRNNYEYSKALLKWALKHDARFMYASSAATYGDGGFGFSDSDENTKRLKPLNTYGLSKHLFDLWILDNALIDRVTGIKFFNIFGPNEYHKGEMRSIICKKYNEILKAGKITLFKSYRANYAHGEQKRDFVYIKDTVNIMWHLFKNPQITGIFNLGTGVARTWSDLAKAMFLAMDIKPKIEYIDMPLEIRDKYQYFTQADMSKLSSKECPVNFMPLEDSVKDYIPYLKKSSRL